MFSVQERVNNYFSLKSLTKEEEEVKKEITNYTLHYKKQLRSLNKRERKLRKMI